MAQTAVEWLYIKMYTHRGNIRIEEYEQAKQMEKEQLENARPQIISNCVIKEISDEEIDEQSKYWNETTNPDMWTFKLAWKAGAKWYREQLKREYNTEMPNNVPYRVQNEAN